MKGFPTSFRDPVYAELDAKNEQRFGLPPGLLRSIRENGERSNADQVSSANARTPYQVIPETRQALIDKHGIDPWLSPATASEAAAVLLKESLDRNRGDVTAAIGEYIGGTDRNNWGRTTRAYIQRVSAGLPSAPPADVQPAGASQPRGTTSSTFDRVFAAQQAAQPQPTQQIAAVYEAYRGGQMTPAEQAEFEQDVKAGRLMLPRGATLLDQPQRVNASTGAPAAANELPAAVVAAYNAGQMTPDEARQLEQDLAQGTVALPPGQQINRALERGFFGRVAEAVTGADRRTAETEAAPDWATMPELNSFSMSSLKAGLGTLMSNPAETVDVIRANFPGVQVRQDQSGNYFLRSSIDGQEYAIKPGFRVSDIPRAAGAVAAFTPAGRATTIAGAGVAAAGTQAAIEATQAATGGSFDPKEVLIAGATGAAVPALVQGARAARDGVADVLARGRGAVPEMAPAGAAAGAAPDPTFVPPGPAQPQPAMRAATVAPEPVPTTQPMPTATAVPAGADEVASTARSASMGGFGSRGATERLAAQAAPDAETVAAADRLGILDNLQPDHYSTNVAYRQLAQLVKSQTGSPAYVAQKEGLDRVAARADELITQMGGTADLSQLNATIRGQLEATQKQLADKADQLYAQVRRGVDAQQEVPAEFVLSFIRRRADDLGGEANLSSMERTILRKLDPKPARREVDGLVIEESRAPTYALLDDVRRDVGSVAGRAGPFKDADTGLAKKLYALISDDQAAVVSRLGLSDVYDAARAAVSTRKGIEDDLSALFGKALDRSLVSDLNRAVRALGSGDAAQLVGFLKSVPQDLRRQTVASGLSTFFQRTARGGEMDFAGYARWFEGLERNRQAYAAIMSNLEPAQVRQLTDLARVARGVSMSKGEFIATGKAINPKALEQADSLIGRVYDEVKRRGVTGVAAEAVGTSAGMPGFASALQTALNQNRPTIAQAADRLITSPEFIALVRAQARDGATAGERQAAARRFAYSRPFARFARALGNPRAMSNRERWVLQALQARNQQTQER